MKKTNTPTIKRDDLSEGALKKIRQAYHALEAFRQTPAHAQAKETVRIRIISPNKPRIK